MSDKEEIWPVIVRYLDGIVDDSDSKKLEEWLAENSENRRVLHSVSQIWKASEERLQNALIEELNLEEDWERISDHISQSDVKEKNARVLKFKRLRKRQQFFSNLMKVAALVLVAVASGYLTLQYAPGQQQKVHQSVFNEIQTSAAERARVELGDGSRVTLNAASKLIMPETFSQSSREVELHGQAFFDIESDKNRPFRIQTRSGLIEVVGTSFDVRSYSDEDVIEVVVREGTVEVSQESDPSQKLIVNEGYKGSILVAENKLNLVWTEDLDSYFAWMDGRLVFKKDPLHKVFRHIERIYDIEIIYTGSDETLLEKEFSADLKTRSVKEVMDVIKMAMDIEFEVDEDRVIIY
ncbi:FecR family protein [Rhodohalobacter sp.]|uniref:FecR family protein n=1 Tax=Rhodohalobacter sp. TaxID=1974210 RepID=UPI002ACD5CB7|nr:FecR domain-containing protein [Rhodohalobacter sp.]MDZ7757965.1 FecR domain-containing protein [Rhodohalobacter sp.]